MEGWDLMKEERDLVFRIEGTTCKTGRGESCSSGV